MGPLAWPISLLLVTAASSSGLDPPLGHWTSLTLIHLSRHPRIVSPGWPSGGFHLNRIDGNLGRQPTKSVSILVSGTGPIAQPEIKAGQLSIQPLFGCTQVCCVEVGQRSVVSVDFNPLTLIGPPKG